MISKKQKFMFKFIDLENTKFKFMKSSWADLNSIFKIKSTLIDSFQLCRKVTHVLESRVASAKHWLCHNTTRAGHTCVLRSATIFIIFSVLSWFCWFIFVTILEILSESHGMLAADIAEQSYSTCSSRTTDSSLLLWYKERSRWVVVISHDSSVYAHWKKLNMIIIKMRRKQQKEKK